MLDSASKVSKSAQWKLSVAPMLDGGYYEGKTPSCHTHVTPLQRPTSGC